MKTAMPVQGCLLVVWLHNVQIYFLDTIQELGLENAQNTVFYLSNFPKIQEIPKILSKIQNRTGFCTDFLITG